MQDNINQLKQNITKAEAFIARFGERLYGSERTDLSVGAYSVRVESRREDAALLGEVFGKSGWVRSIDPYGNGQSFMWTKVVDGIEIKIANAEDLELNGTPVPERAFPVLLENS